MRGRRRGSIGRNQKFAGGLLAAAVAAGTAYAVPATAEAAPNDQTAARAAGGHHLSTRLTALVGADQANLGPAATAAELGLPASGPGSLLRTPDGERVVVDLRLAAADDSVIDAVEAAGAELLSDPADFGRVAVAVLPEDLTAIGGVAGVEYVGEEQTPQVSAVCDATHSEGDALLNADDLRATGVDGTGVKVGVLSDSYNMGSGLATTAAQDITNDDLPGAANTCGHTTVSTIADRPAAGTDEGRAMMQIVHDLAPGAALDFETAFISEPTFAAGITKLADQGASVIVDDVTYFDEPMYQDGIVEQAVTGVRARGVNYFSSSANNRLVKNDHEVGSYEAVAGYRPTACPAIITGHVDCHNFGTVGAPDSTFTYTGGASTTIRVVLNWAEPWGAVNTDYDLYLVNESTSAVTAGDAINTGGGSQQAYEFVGLVQGSSAPIRDIIVARKSATPPAAAPRFKLLFAGNGADLFNTMTMETPLVGTDVMGPTAFGHNGGADAMSVGASDVRVTSHLNDYSSYGPVTTLFGPVSAAAPAAPLATPKVVAKPDIVASDCNLTSFFSGASHVFCGTSAAAPHAAAIAALLRQKFPAATTEAINAAMVNTAVPMPGAPGSFQGAGLLNALAAGTAPPAPTITGVAPASPGASTTPKVTGTAQNGSTVRLYATADCSGSPVTTSTAAAFPAGLTVSVGVRSTTTWHATATSMAGTSSCSPTSATYTQQNVPDTLLTKSPKATVATTKSKAKVSFEFTSTEAGSTFTCSIDGRAFTACTSGVRFKLKPGKHTFAVRATTNGVTDPTPATSAFKVKRKKRHH